MTRRPPWWIAALLLAGIFAAGWTLVSVTPPTSSTSDGGELVTLTLPGETMTRVIRKVTRGRVVTLPGGTKVVRVPVLVIRTDDHTIRVPAHFVKLRRLRRAGGLASSTVGAPLVPVTVTVYLPGSPGPTVTVTSVTTTTEVILSTVTLPLTTGGNPEQEATK